MHEANVH